MLLLDTDVMVDLLRGYPPAVAWLNAAAGQGIGVPGFVVMELVQGCRSREEQRVVEAELKKVSVLWPRPDSCDRALSTFAQFHLSHGLGLLDALIAGLAIERALPLHTFNEKHYRPIPGLHLVRPYARSSP